MFKWCGFLLIFWLEDICFEIVLFMCYLYGFLLVVCCYCWWYWFFFCFDWVDCDGWLVVVLVMGGEVWYGLFVDCVCYGD